MKLATFISARVLGDIQRFRRDALEVFAEERRVDKGDEKKAIGQS